MRGLHESRWPAIIRQTSAVALGAVLPGRCMACGRVVEMPGTVCPACWGRLQFLTPPWCERCGTPMQAALDNQPSGPPGIESSNGPVLCGGCLRRPPPFDRVRSALVYDDVSADMLLAFKHGDRTDLARGLGDWLVMAGGDLIDRADVLVPVPLHFWRLVWRRYNQSALLAHVLAHRTGIPVAPRALKRLRRTPSQAMLRPAQRARNVKGAFQVRPALRDQIARRRIILIDDVLTTGATVEECARTLKRAGAAEIAVLTVARVVKAR